jgi:putative hydrolase of the HAD superfamily
MHPAFQHVTAWVFDLDNTLYPPSSRLFDQIEVRMTAWVARELGVDPATANHLRDHYWRTHGTTLAGLMREHGVDPGPYLTDVHDIDLSGLLPDPTLAAGIAALPGRRIVYTNGGRDYAHRVIAARGLSGVFDAVYSVEDAGFRPKPEAEAFAAVFGRDGLDPRRGAMFEDDARNLAVPHALGMACVHIAPEPEPEDQPHVHHHATDLSAFLTAIMRG